MTMPANGLLDGVLPGRVIDVTADQHKLMPWDHADGWLIHQEAGGYSAHFDGSTYLATVLALVLPRIERRVQAGR
jgi:fructose-1,6-bisphosphatase/inositol monophosphatase family enzyme